MIKTQKPTIVFLMETKVLKYKLDSLKVKLGFQNLFFVDGVGQSGGLVVFWKEDLSLSIQSFSHKHINAWVISEENTKWMLTSSYGHPMTNLRMLGYNILKALRDLNPRMWLCNGDFNELLYNHDKCGGAERQTESNAASSPVFAGL